MILTASTNSNLLTDILNKTGINTMSNIEYKTKIFTLFFYL